MKARIDALGRIEIEPENTTEAYALAMWRQVNDSEAANKKFLFKPFTITADDAGVNSPEYREALNRCTESNPVPC